MSSYLIYHIEYKRRYDDPDWKLVSMLVPKDKVDFYSDRKCDAIIDGKEYYMSNEESVQGFIRDIFSHTWYDPSFTDRGFPKDMSQELKDYFHKQDEKDIEEHKKLYGDDSEFRDYRYSKTWCTLSELQSYQQQLLKEAEEDIERYKEKDSFSKISKRLDRLETIVSGKEPSNKVVEENEESDYYLPELNEHLEEVVWLGEWIHGINAIVDFYSQSWTEKDYIRIVCYIG